MKQSKLPHPEDNKFSLNFYTIFTLVNGDSVIH